MWPSRSCWKGIKSALQPEEITSKGTRVSCLLSIKEPIRKKSGNLSYSPRIIYHIVNRAKFGWGCSIHRLHLCRRGKTPHNECPKYVTKQSDGEIPVMLVLWAMLSIPLFLSLRGLLCLGMVVHHRVLSMS